MTEYTEYNGKQYHRYPGSKRKSDARYYRRGKNYLHRVVWETHNGPIPRGHQIHHINGDFGDNRIENLQCVAPREHSLIHAPEMADQRRAHLDNVRHKAAAWHSTPEGREWHREHGRRVFAEAHKPIIGFCQMCSAEYTTTTLNTHSRFCSNACKSAWRRKAGVDNVHRACLNCHTTFSINRYSKTQYCSRKCSQQARRLRELQPQTSDGPS